MTVERELGEHEARIDTLEERLNRFEQKLDRIVAATEQAAGGWKVLMSVGAISGTVGAAIAKFFSTLKVGP